MKEFCGALFIGLSTQRMRRVRAESQMKPAEIQVFKHINAFIVGGDRLPRLSAMISLPLENALSAAILEAWTP